MPRRSTRSRRGPRVGVAFGGGSARGLAHIGVIRWFEEHHIPIDVAAGTSMGGLVGGAFAAGMSAEELRTLIAATDWDAMFGSSSFAFKNVRRKEDARDFPSRLEFGLKGGIVAPTSLNNGQQVDFLLARIAAGYPDLDTFDQLPTPFRTVAVDLQDRRTGRDRSRIARGGDARDDVAAGRLPAGRGRQSRPRRRRRARQRPGRRRPGHGRGVRHRHRRRQRAGRGDRLLDVRPDRATPSTR